MNEETIQQRLEEALNDDLETGTSSDTLQYAIEEFPELILALLKTNDDSEMLDLVRELQEASFDVFKQENYDSVSRTIVDDTRGE